MNPGELLFHFVNTIIVTTLVSTFVLWRYRAGVLNGMQAGGASELSLSVATAASPARAPTAVEAVRVWERRVRRRLAAAILSVVGLCALPLGFLWMQQSGLPVTPAHVLLGASGAWLAAIPMIAATLSLSLRRASILGLQLFAALCAAVVVLFMVQRLAVRRAPSLDQLLNAWNFLAFTTVRGGPPLLLLFATGAPRIRGVAPITFVGLLVFGLAPLIGSRVTMWMAATQTGSDVVLRLGLNAAFVALALPTGWMAFRRLRSVARAFETKRLSDVELLARVWWLMFVAETSIELVNSTGRWLVPLGGGAAIYLAFAIAYPRVLRRVGLPAPRPPARTLLLLRVFGYTRRTERLFDRIGARWRLFGPVTMIAAPDVVARTVDPGDFLRYVNGRLATSFVTSRDDLADRVRALDVEPDPDGRYRVNEWCCQRNTWRAAVVTLMDRADAIVMDLRGLTGEHGGCEFELQQLAQRVEPGRVVLVVDDTTDREMIARSMGPAAGVRAIAMPTGRDADAERVFVALLEAGYT